MRYPLVQFRLWSFVLIFAFLTCVFASTQAAQLSDQLASTLSAKRSGDFLSVLVFMRQQPDIVAIRATHHLKSDSRRESHKILIDALKDFANTEQGDLRQTLDDASVQGEVSSYESYWIANAFQVRATKSFIEILQARSDIAVLIEDLPLQSLYYPPAQSTIQSAKGLGVSAGLRTIGADSMWALGYTGIGTLIASFDTGVNGKHPALIGSYRGNHGYSPQECWYDPVYNQSYPHWDPSLGETGKHGSETMGVMVGKDDATGDTVGVAFGAEWISAMVVDIPGANYLAAFQWIADPDGDPNTIDDVPDVLNNSWGFKQSNVGCMDIFWTAIDNLEALGTVVVFACGNEGPSPFSLRNPANRATTIYNSYAVGGTLVAGDTAWTRSSRGPSDCDSVSIKPQVTAPGYNIRTTNADTNVGYSSVIGTSFAAPHVAGAVALLRQYNPNASVDTIKWALMKSAVDKGTPGPDNTYGWGRINVMAALRLLPPNSEPNIYVQSVSHDSIHPGDVVDVVVTLKNSGVGASAVTGQLANPVSGISIINGFASFGDLPLNESGSNAASPYRLQLSSSIFEGSQLTVDLQVQAAGGSYQRTIKLYFVVGTALAKTMYTHVTDSCQFTVSNYGVYGLAHESILSRGGAGFLYPSTGSNNLYQCGLLIATDSNHVSDGVVNMIGSVDEDFDVVPGGNLTPLANGLLGDQETISRFADSHAKNPLGITVEQRTASYDSTRDANYVIMEYKITNNGLSAVNGIYVGLYCDWDFPWGSGGYDRSGFGRDLNLGYLWYQNQPDYRGTAILNREGASTFFAIRNSSYIYDGVSESEKFSFLTHHFADTASLTSYDQSYCIATGPFDLSPGASDTAAFVMIGAKDLASLRNSASMAKAHFDTAASFLCGDVDRSGIVDISDAIFLVDFIFGAGMAPDPLRAGDVDCSLRVDLSDVVYLVNYVFGAGITPCALCLR